MTLQAAAAHLLEFVNLPPGAVNVLPIPSEGGGRLIVWIDSRHIRQVRDLPTSFEGYEIFIEPRPDISPQPVSVLRGCFVSFGQVTRAYSVVTFVASKS